MRIKNKQTKPDTMTDIFENLDLPEATEASRKLDKKSFNALLKIISLKGSSNILELLQLKTHFKKIKELKIYIQIEMKYADKYYPYNFLNSRGLLIPEYEQKEIYTCNFLDAEIMSKGELNSKDRVVQLFTAIILVLCALTKSIIGKVINPTITIEESAQQCQKIIDTYEENRRQSILSIFNNLGKAIQTYGDLIVLNSFIHDPKISKEIRKIDSTLADKLLNTLESMHIQSGKHLEQAINLCITEELFKEYQRSSTTNKPKVLCQGHSLLNSQFLLKKLNGKALNAEGNLQKKRNYDAMDQKILELLKQERFKKQFKNKSSAAEKISDKISNDVEIFIENDRNNNNFKHHIKIENLPKKILQLIEKNPKIKDYLIQATD